MKSSSSSKKETKKKHSICWIVCDLSITQSHTFKRDYLVLVVDFGSKCEYKHCTIWTHTSWMFVSHRRIIFIFFSFVVVSRRRRLFIRFDYTCICGILCYCVCDVRVAFIMLSLPIIIWFFISLVIVYTHIFFFRFLFCLAHSECTPSYVCSFTWTKTMESGCCTALPKRRMLWIYAPTIG